MNRFIGITIIRNSEEKASILTSIDD